MQQDGTAPRDRASIRKEQNYFFRELTKQLAKIRKLNAYTIAQLPIDDPLLYQAYAYRFGAIGGIGLDSSGWSRIIDSDITRRGKEANPLLVRLFREEPIDQINSLILRWLEDAYFYPLAEPVLEEARQAYRREGQTWHVDFQGNFARALGKRGVASDLVILREMQARWGGKSLLSPINYLERRILIDKKKWR